MNRSIGVVAAQVAPVPYDREATFRTFEGHVRALAEAFPNLELYVFPEVYLTGLGSWNDGYPPGYVESVAEPVGGGDPAVLVGARLDRVDVEVVGAGAARILLRPVAMAAERVAVHRYVVRLVHPTHDAHRGVEHGTRLPLLDELAALTLRLSTIIPVTLAISPPRASNEEVVRSGP